MQCVSRPIQYSAAVIIHYCVRFYSSNFFFFYYYTFSVSVSNWPFHLYIFFFHLTFFLHFLCVSYSSFPSSPAFKFLHHSSCQCFASLKFSSPFHHFLHHVFVSPSCLLLISSSLSPASLSIHHPFPPSPLFPPSIHQSALHPFL